MNNFKTTQKQREAIIYLLDHQEGGGYYKHLFEKEELVPNDSITLEWYYDECPREILVGSDEELQKYAYYRIYLENTEFFTQLAAWQKEAFNYVMNKSESPMKPSRTSTVDIRLNEILNAYRNLTQEQMDNLYNVAGEVYIEHGKIEDDDIFKEEEL